MNDGQNQNTTKKVTEAIIELLTTENPFCDVFCNLSKSNFTE